MSKDPKSTYYDAGGIETLDVIKAKLTDEQYKGYLLGNAIKYNCRMMHKHEGPERQRDAEKAYYYTKELMENFDEVENAAQVDMFNEGSAAAVKKAFGNFIEVEREIALWSPARRQTMQAAIEAWDAKHNEN